MRFIILTHNKPENFPLRVDVRNVLCQYITES
jgi:hypothetical protein